MTDDQRIKLCDILSMFPMFADRKKGDKYHLQGPTPVGQWWCSIDANTGAYQIECKDNQGREYPPPEWKEEADNQIINAARNLVVASRFKGMSSYNIPSNLGQLVTEAIAHTKANPLTEEDCWWSRKIYDSMLRQAERDHLEDIEQDIKELDRKAFDRGGKFTCQQRLAMMLATGIKPDSDLWEVSAKGKVVGTVSTLTGNPMAVSVDSMPLEDLPRSSTDPDRGLFGPIKVLDEYIEQLSGSGGYKKYLPKAKKTMVRYFGGKEKEKPSIADLVGVKEKLAL